MSAVHDGQRIQKVLVDSDSLDFSVRSVQFWLLKDSLNSRNQARTDLKLTRGHPSLKVTTDSNKKRRATAQWIRSSLENGVNQQLLGRFINNLEFDFH